MELTAKLVITLGTVTTEVELPEVEASKNYRKVAIAKDVSKIGFGTFYIAPTAGKASGKAKPANDHPSTVALPAKIIKAAAAK